MTYSAPRSPLTAPITTSKLAKLCAEQKKFATVALYDASMAHLAENAGIEVILVGDSLGMTLQGHDSTLPVTVSDMIYHIRAVKRGNSHSLILGDMPFMSYATKEQALTTAGQLMQAGANVVKLEGGAWLADTFQLLTERGIPTCAHLGLTPQSVNKFGGFKVQGRGAAEAQVIIDDALALENAGADIILLECVPQVLTQAIQAQVSVPTIGIGAGSGTDGQVLVINDLLGMTAKPPKFSKDFLAQTNGIENAIAAFGDAVREGVFPDESHVFK